MIFKGIHARGTPVPEYVKKGYIVSCVSEMGGHGGGGYRILATQVTVLVLYERILLEQIF